MRTLFLFLILIISISTQAQKVWSEWACLPIEQESVVWNGEDYIVNVPKVKYNSNSLIIYKRDTVNNEMILYDSLFLKYSGIYKTAISKVQDDLFVVVSYSLDCDLIHLNGIIVVSKHGVIKAKSNILTRTWEPDSKLDLIVYFNDDVLASLMIGNDNNWVTMECDFGNEMIYAWDSSNDLDWFNLEPYNLLQKGDNIYYLIDGIPHMSDLLDLEKVSAIGHQPVDNWTIDDINHNIIGYKDSSIFFFSDSLDVQKSIISSHEISSISAIKGSVLWHGDEDNDTIRWSIFQDSIRASALHLNEHIHDVRLNLTNDDVMVSGYQYLTGKYNGRLCGASQFYYPIENMEAAFDDDVELISFSYDYALELPCRTSPPSHVPRSFRVVKPRLVFRNNGSQNLTEINVGGMYDVGHPFCPPFYYNSWMKVETNTKPGKLDTFSWPEIIIPCNSSKINHVCLYAHTPNYLLDNDFSNNYICSDFILSDDTPNDHCNIQISPNPTSHSITISGCSNLRQAFLFNHSGVMVKKITDLKSEISLSELPAGMYFLKVEKEKGESRYERILITK